MSKLTFVVLLALSFAAARSRCQNSPGMPAGTAPSCASRALLGAGPARIQGAFADPRIDVAYYKLDLTIQTSPPLLIGRVTVRGTILDDSLRTVTLDFNAAMRTDSIRAAAGKLQFVQLPLGLTVTLDRAYRRGETLSFDVYYRGLPVSSGFGSFQFFAQNGTPWVWSLSQPYGARDWWPCKDNTTDKADSVDIWITCANGLKAGSNGRLVDVRPNANGTTTFQWAERYPIAAYLVSIAVTNFAEFTDWFRYTASDSMPILNYVLPQDLAQARNDLALTPAMLSVFSGRFGLYPFIREKYGHAQFGWGGAMEHQTMTSTTNFEENTVAHELAHQWFGDMITCANWPSLWLNEGFATYAEALWREATYGAGAYHAHLNGIMSRAMRATGTLYVQDTSTVASLFTYDRVYAKGAWVLHMLRHVLGDSLFFRALRSYADDPRFRFRSATTEGFRSVCEAAAGIPLGYFFDQWVFGEGYPQYSFEWSAGKAGEAYDVRVRLTQSATGTDPAFFAMPVDIRMTNGTRDTTVVAFQNSRAQEFVFRLPFNPVDVQLDPDKWILRDVLPSDSQIPAGYVLRQNYPNPFNAGTAITFALPRRSEATLSIYDLLGREVVQLSRERWEAGVHTLRWSGNDASGRPVASGIYFYRLTAGDFTAARLMVLLR